MQKPTLNVIAGGKTIYAKFACGSVRLPLQKNERDNAIVALREALSIFEDSIPSDAAKESG